MEAYLRSVGLGAGNPWCASFVYWCFGKAAEALGPGMIFIMDHSNGLGHIGLIERESGGVITTLEGNSNTGGSREGVGVFRLTRKTNSVNKGFIDYGSVTGY